VELKAGNHVVGWRVGGGGYDGQRHDAHRVSSTWLCFVAAVGLHCLSCAFSKLLFESNSFIGQFNTRGWVQLKFGGNFSGGHDHLDQKRT
jgi:hypothetical protein